MNRPATGVFGRLRGTVPSLVAVAMGVLGLLLGPAAPGADAAAGQSSVADYVEVSGFVDPPAVAFLLRQVAAAQEDGSAVLIIRLDSPGALKASVDPVVHAIAESRVPVVVWVAPGDARAGPGVAPLVLAAHRAVASPEATVGPAHPLDLRDYRPQAARAIEPTLAQLTAAAAAGGRDPDRERDEQLSSQALAAGEALDQGVLDAIEPNVQELLGSLRGAELRAAGERVSLPDAPFTLRFMKMSLLERLVHTAIQPEFAYLLLLVGFFGLIFELYNPGLGLAAVAGAICLAFSVHAFTVLPVSWLAVGALVAAIGLMNLDLSRGLLGVLSVLAGVLLIAGTLFLYAGSHPAVGLDWWAAGGGLAMTGLFFVSVMTSAIRARTAKPLPGAEGILEAVGVARSDIDPDGQVMARGTLWRARTLGAAIGEGTPVKVKGVSGLMLMVEPTDEAPAPADVQADVQPEVKADVQAAQDPGPLAPEDADSQEG